MNSSLEFTTSNFSLLACIMPKLDIKRPKLFEKVFHVICHVSIPSGSPERVSTFV